MYIGKCVGRLLLYAGKYARRFITAARIQVRPMENGWTDSVRHVGHTVVATAFTFRWGLAISIGALGIETRVDDRWRGVVKEVLVKRIMLLVVVVVLLAVVQRGSIAQVEPKRLFFPIIVNDARLMAVAVPVLRPTPAPAPSSSLFIIDVVMDEFYPGWCKAYGTIYPPDGLNDGIVTWMDVYGPACFEIEIGDVCYCPVIRPQGYCTEVVCDPPAPFWGG